MKGLRGLDPGRERLARELAAWRERRAVEHDRPRGWILDDAGLREVVMRVPRSAQALAQIRELPAGLVQRRGAELLACVTAAAVPDPAPAVPDRAPSDPTRAALLRKLAAIVQNVAAELAIAPEVLATRRDLEQLAAGSRMPRCCAAGGALPSASGCWLLFKFAESACGAFGARYQHARTRRQRA